MLNNSFDSENSLLMVEEVPEPWISIWEPKPEKCEDDCNQKPMPTTSIVKDIGSMLSTKFYTA